MSEGIWAKSILASEHAITGKGIDTILVRMPRCILAEFNTHRAFSRNAASSRAIPVKKIIEQVEKDPFIPMKWTKNEPGMQGYIPHHDPELCQMVWLRARNEAVGEAKHFNSLGLHKQIVNRLLEPWMWTIVLVTATEWDNFFKLRNHPAAEPHMQILAQKIWEARENATRQQLEPGQWHLPFITQDEWMMQVPKEDRHPWTVAEHLVKLSVARCASTSYKTVDGFDMTLDRAQKIYDSLLSDPLHASPFEHVARADEVREVGWYIDSAEGDYMNPKEHRNFVGFRQLRAQIERY